jgi:uncharacterized membrane protein YjfL (UPF0719 family)
VYGYGETGFRKERRRACFLKRFLPGLISTVIFGLIGIVLLLLGYCTFDKILNKINFQEEIKGNPLAVSIVIAAFFASLSHIIASVVH